MQKKVKIGLNLINQHGDMHQIRRCWEQAEELGVDQIFLIDHFRAQSLSADIFDRVTGSNLEQAGQSFEATSLQAALAATTTRVEVGCAVHAVGFRNPNLLADIARTIDHISDGRFILGMGTGYQREEYEDYGYEFGTAQSRMQDLINAVTIIKARFEKLSPKPIRKIPIMLGTMHERVGMRLVAEQADMWHLFGPVEKMRQKIEVFGKICEEVKRPRSEVTLVAHCVPHMIPDHDPDVLYGELGIANLTCINWGPKFDLGPMKELIAWRDALR